MSDLIRASLSIEKKLMERFDAFIERSGHKNRSEAMRDLIRTHLVEDAWRQDCNEILASVTLLYDHSKRRVAMEMEAHGHEHHDVVLSSMHIHVSADLCLEVVILRGEPREVEHIANHLIGLPGVLHGHAVYSRPDLTELLK